MTPTPNPPALLPCPWCGGEAVLKEELDYNTAQPTGLFWVQCDPCDVFPDSAWHKPKEAAIAAWNTRAPAEPKVSREAVAGTANLEGIAGAVSDDAIRHLQIRDGLNRAVYRAIRDYRMSNMADEDGYAYPLVDLMSNPAPSDIGTGEMEMIALADDVAEAARLALSNPPADVAGWRAGVEAAAKVAEGCMLEDCCIATAIRNLAAPANLETGAGKAEGGDLDLIGAVTDLFHEVLNEHGAQGYGRDRPAQHLFTEVVSKLKRDVLALIASPSALLGAASQRGEKPCS